jgi:hypothetical protein
MNVTRSSLPASTLSGAVMSSPSSGRRLMRLAATALALTGWVIGLGLTVYLLTSDAVSSGPGFAVGIDMEAYLRAGDDLVAGRSVYVGVIGEAGAFSYAPPWVVLFGALAWVPDLAMHVGMFALSLLAIRYVAGSWLWSGLIFLYPVSIMVMLSGNIEFLIAAAIVLAAHGHAGPLALTALAKVSPALAIPRSGWREAAFFVGIAIIVTLPWLHLWPEWIEYLLRQPSTIDIHIGPPWYVRLPFALALLLLRRPWASAAAVVVAMPSLWLGSLVILTAAMRLWLDGRRQSLARSIPLSPA